MPAKSLDLFTTQYSVKFWKKNAATFEQGHVVVRARPIQNLPTGPGIAITYADQLETRAVLEQMLTNSRTSAAPDGLITVSGNVQTFNEAFPNMPKLAHPAALIRGPVPLTLRQLNYEYTQLELGNVADAVDVQSAHGPLSPPQAPKLYSDLDKYDRQARLHLKSEKARLTFKYDYLEHLAGAAFHHIEMPRDVAERFDIRVLMPPQKQALKELHKSIKRSLTAAKGDLVILENFYSRAAAGAVQLQRATFDRIDAANRACTTHEPGLTRAGDNDSTLSTPRGEQPDYAIAPMRLPNLFGPGELLITTAYTASRMQKLYETSFDTIDALRTQILRPRTSELAVLDKSYTQLLLASSVKPVVLGPMRDGRLFERDPQRFKLED